MNTLPDFTREEKLRAIAREIALRERLYPAKVKRNEMSRDKAAHEISIMRAIARDYGGHGGNQE